MLAQRARLLWMPPVVIVTAAVALLSLVVFGCFFDFTEALQNEFVQRPKLAVGTWPQSTTFNIPKSTKPMRKKTPTSTATPKPFIDISFNSAFLDERRSSSTASTTASLSARSIRPDDLNEAIANATALIEHRLNELEPYIYKNGASQRPDSLGYYVGGSLRAGHVARNYSRSALIAEETSRQLVRKYRLNLDQIIIDLTELPTQETELGAECPKLQPPGTCFPGKYRSYSGHCNNVERPEWGAANEAYSRALAPRYADGVSKPRRALSGKELPSARRVSLAVHQAKESNYGHMTTITTFFGQFIFHDLAHSAQVAGHKGARIGCCGLSRANLMHPECFPIVVGASDPLMGKLGQECIEYVRSAPAIRAQCGLGPREQINQVSSFLDGSALYGSSKEMADSLRTFHGGRLKSSKLTKKEKEMLPMDETGLMDCKANNGTIKKSGNNRKRCFRSGDMRANENLGLTLIHTLFLREHNRVAGNLAQLNPAWSDEMIYEESRRIVGAELQHIAYKDFLPHVLGEETIDNFGLRLLTDGYYGGYDLSVNPTIENAVAHAVFAFLFTTMPEAMERYSKDLHMEGAMRMGEMFFDTTEAFGNKLDEYLMGMISQNGRQADAFVIDEVTNSLTEDELRAFDFVAFTIQQGRDHGLPGYVEFRRACRLEPQVVDGFEDLATVVKSDVLKRLSSLYASVFDVDLFTGGLAERPMAGALVGPTFSCLLARQFDFLRRGDRFWYENDLPPSAFSKEQLAEVRKASLARILCDNGDRMDFVQPEVMVTSDVFLNAFQYCTTDIIGRLDLTKWKTTSRETISNLSISDKVLENEFAQARRAANDRFEKDRLIGPAGSGGMLSHSQLLHYKTTRAKKVTLQISNQSLVFEKATYGVLRHLRHGRDRETHADMLADVNQLVFSLSKLELADYIKNEALLQSAINGDEQCYEQAVPCDHTSPYRTISGWCNNLAHPDFGQSNTLFERFLSPAYDDGIGWPRWRSRRGKRAPLPSARAVSTIVHDDVSTPHVRYSLAMMQFGQFLDHDVTFTPQYLTSGGQLLNCKACESSETVHPECWPIEIPRADPYFSQKGVGGRQCLHFVRSINGQRTLGRREQMNQLTSYIDSSNIYGSDVCEAQKLRAFTRGRLNSTRHPVRGFKDLLPQTATHIECKAPSGYCFMSGDMRASEQPSLACMHTIWLREHNRIVEELAKLNSHWDDERLYQMGRKIIGALMQQITYGEFLPRLVGMDYADRFGLKLETNGYYERYDSKCTAMLRNEFSAAVFRLGHTLLKPSFERLDVNYRIAQKPLKLREAFFNSDMLYAPGAIDQLLRGLVTSSIETFDRSITKEVTNHLFEERGRPFSGMDLVSLNIQRARDHALQPYNEYRRLCNLTLAKNFEELADEVSPVMIGKLKKVYDHVDDIDLFTGGISETPLHGALVGPTFGCLLGMQFAYLRRCDRFWYESADPLLRFTEDQLSEIRKVRLAKIMCANGDEIPRIQKSALDLSDPFLNPRLPCSSLPEMNLAKWRDVQNSCPVADRGRPVPLGRHRRTSPCVSCVCTTEGLTCRSMRIDNCRQLQQEYSSEEIAADTACVVQCSYLLDAGDNAHSSSMAKLLEMLNVNKKKRRRR